MTKLKSFLYYTKNWFSMSYYWILKKLSIDLSTNDIPKDTFYCYHNEEDNNFNCKYYKPLGNGLNGCGFLGVVTDDMIFDDQCKICGEKENLN